ncbi:hypothetical protein THAOC_17945, partial [Thalassiosira oceanica]
MQTHRRRTDRPSTRPTPARRRRSSPPPRASRATLSSRRRSPLHLPPPPGRQPDLPARPARGVPGLDRDRPAPGSGGGKRRAAEGRAGPDEDGSAEAVESAGRRVRGRVAREEEGVACLCRSSSNGMEKMG